MWRWPRAESAVVGAVALPAVGVTLSTADPPPLAAFDDTAAPRLVVSRSRPPDVAYDVAEAIGGVMYPDGLGRGQDRRRDHGPGRRLHPCRRAVRVGLVCTGGGGEACGLHASRLNGDPLRYGAPDAWLPDLMVCRPELAEAVLRVTTLY